MLIQFIDKELHEAFQHTGPHAIAKAIEAAGSAMMLVPGVEQLKEAKMKEAAREVVIETTPLSFSMMLSDVLGSFFDYCERTEQRGQNKGDKSNCRKHTLHIVYCMLSKRWNEAIRTALASNR